MHFLLIKVCITFLLFSDNIPALLHVVHEVVKDFVKQAVLLLELECDGALHLEGT
jgi:hypothetical protein